MGPKMKPQSTVCTNSVLLRTVCSIDRNLLSRSVIVAALVGPFLTIVNQREAFFGAGSVDLVKAGLTFVIPFLVSSVSGAMARRSASHESYVRVEGLVRKITQISTTVEQIRSNAEAVNETAKARYEQTKMLLEVAQQTVEDIEGGATLVQEALAATAKVQSHFDEVIATEDLVKQEIRNRVSSTATMSSAVTTTRSRFSEISALAYDIGRLGHQTTLLSLNAAVVAATAGPEGKRFAAIAESVRELARDTEAHAKKIDITMRELERSAADMASQSDKLRQGTKRLQESSDESNIALSRASKSMALSISPTRASMEMLARQSVQIRSVANGIVNVVDHAEAAISGSAKNVELAHGVLHQLTEVTSELATDRS